jgi:hypothetical protein
MFYFRLIIFINAWWILWGKDQNNTITNPIKTKESIHKKQRDWKLCEKRERSRKRKNVNEVNKRSTINIYKRKIHMLNTAKKSKCVQMQLLRKNKWTHNRRTWHLSPRSRRKRKRDRSNPIKTNKNRSSITKFKIRIRQRKNLKAVKRRH